MAYEFVDEEVPAKSGRYEFVDETPKKEQTGDLYSSSVIKGASGLAGLPADVLTLIGRPFGNLGKPEFAQHLTKDAIVKGIEKLTGTPLYKPETTGERYFEKGVEGAMSMPTRVGTAVMGALSGIGGEAGHDVAGVPGAIAGSVLPFVAAPLAAKTVGWGTDLVTGRLPDVRAGKVARDVAGDKRAAIEAAMAGKGSDVTAAQAAVGAGSTRWSALGDRAAQQRSEYFKALEDRQVAERAAALAGVKPDLNAATTARETATKPLYDAARKGLAPVDTTKVLANLDDTLLRNSGNPELVTALKSIRAGLVDDAGNVITNAERVMSVIDGVKAKLASKDNKFILEKLIDTREGLKNAVPGVSAADAEFRRLSQPVNQAKVIQAMEDVLTNYKGGERVQPFLNVLGRGETALLKKSTGFPRYESGDMNKILTPKQLDAVSKVESELLRDARLSDLATAGKTDVANVLSQDASKWRLPMWLNRYVTAANKGLDIAESALNAKTMAKVYEAMENPNKALELLKTLPTSEQNKALKMMVELKNMPYKVRLAQEAAQRQPTGLLAE
jgi:DNA-binding cell septation regulator SpoVG